MYNGQVIQCPKTSVMLHGHDFYRTQTIRDNMDTQKDMTEKNVSRHDTVSDTASAPAVAYNNRNEFSALCLKRTERLSAALYMVTGLMPDGEPLKWRLREKTLVLLSDLSSARETLPVDTVSATDRARDTVAEIITLLNVAFAGDLLSEMNVAVLKKEYLALATILEEGRTLTTGTERIVSDLFKEEYTNTASPFSQYASHASEHKGETVKGHIKDNQYNMSDRKMSVTKDVRYTETSPIVSFTTETKEADHLQTRVSSLTHKNDKTTKPIEDIKKERRNEIVAIIKRKKHVSIKDITLIMRHVGEKTIQREITAMVEEGVLKKQGSKRWSTYSLA